MEELERWEATGVGGVAARSKPSLTVVTGVWDTGGLGVLLAEDANDLQRKRRDRRSSVSAAHCRFPFAG